MALDNAQFISELSLTDPPGTDPLNQGDDQIRTVKRATQQSFPNINAPVPQTAAQMAQMAIKNEINVFTQTNNFDERVTFRNTNTDFNEALGGNNSLRFRQSGANIWIIQHVGSTEQFRIRRYIAGVFQDDPVSINNASGVVTFVNKTKFPDGAEATPGIEFATAGTGFFATAGSVNVAIGGANVFSMSNNGLFAATGVAFQGDGTMVANRPAFVFSNDPDTGMYREAANTIGWATAGVRQMTLGTGLTLFGDAGGGNMLNLSGEGGAGFPGYQILSTTGALRFQMFLFQSNNEITLSAFNASGVSVGVISETSLATRVVDFKVRPTVNGVPI